jgi:hypothetical protein
MVRLCTAKHTKRYYAFSECIYKRQIDPVLVFFFFLSALVSCTFWYCRRSNEIWYTERIGKYRSPSVTCSSYFLFKKHGFLLVVPLLSMKHLSWLEKCVGNALSSCYCYMNDKLLLQYKVFLWRQCYQIVDTI